MRHSAVGLAILAIALSGCGFVPNPERVITTVPTDATLPSSCDLAYPDFCVPRGLRELECQSVGSDFTVFPPDPYGFDPDDNGVGCESES